MFQSLFGCAVIKTYKTLRRRKTVKGMSLVCVNDYEAAACKRVHKHALDYYQSGAGHELALRLNCTSFDKYEPLTTSSCRLFS